MQLISHQSHLGILPEDAYAEFIIKSFEQTAKESDRETIPTKFTFHLNKLLRIHI